MYRRRLPIKHLIILVGLLLIGLALSESFAPITEAAVGAAEPIQSSLSRMVRSWMFRPRSTQMYQTCAKFTMSFMDHTAFS